MGSKNFLSFLANAKVEDVTDTEKKKSGVSKKDRQPAPLQVAIRLWKDGSVYPSEAAINKFDLNYLAASITKEPIPLKEGQPAEEQKFRNEYYYVAGNGYGFDVIDTRKWGQYKAEGNLLLIAPVERVINKDGKSVSTPKVDLFSSVGYNDDGTPKTTVAEQGAVTFGKDVLITLVEELYGLTLTEEKPFVDLLITSEPIPGSDINVTELFSKELAFYPKRVVRGKDAGKDDYIRREKTKVYAFIPAELLEGGEVTDNGDEEGAE